MDFSKGSPEPLGLSIQGDSANFALFSSSAKKVVLGLFYKGYPEIKIPMNRTGDIWHIEVAGAPIGGEYAFQCDENEAWLADPYAKVMGTGTKAKIAVPKPFDWQGIQSPHIPTSDLIIFEMHVRGYTQHPSSLVAKPGTYLGMIEKIPFLKEIGVNAVELMPIYEFDQHHCKNCLDTQKPRVNYWGYDPLHFFAPMRWYANNDPIDEFKTLVRELHRNGIEVFLDVVYNHTGEDKNHFIHFRGIDSHVYYMMNQNGDYLDFTGCGNTVNANHPVVQQLILDSLHYWVEEMHVDGFRFDLASVLTRDQNGHPMKNPPLIEKISKDPVISKVKLIAEAWDAAGLYQLGVFSQWGPWIEWNGHYRDEVRKFIKGHGSKASHFANVLCGSNHLYPAPICSVNFVTAHDGFTLRDLVTYQKKYNTNNGELNKDGSDHNDSWNCGTEGPTDDPNISALRERQMRNFFVALILSQGIPMILMNDIYGHTRNGNNNPYVQDNELNWFLWDQLNPKMTQFVASLINLRKNYPQLGVSRPFTTDDVEWHGLTPMNPDWNSQFIALTLKGKTDLYIAFNANEVEASVELPPSNWTQIVHTGDDWIFVNKNMHDSKIKLPPYSAFLAKKENSLL